MNKNIPIFSIGFRPFFLLASLLAVVNPTYWISFFTGNWEFLPLDSPLFWHSHEMIFGFSSALIAGFLLTASANWTGTTPYKGWPLFFLVLLWCIERLSYFIPVGETGYVILSNIFFPVFIIYLFIKLKDHPKQLSVFVPFLFLLGSAKMFHILGYVYTDSSIQESGLLMGVALVRAIVFLIAGRVLPFFTRKKLNIETTPVPPNLQKLTMISLALLCIPFFYESHPNIHLGVLVFALLANTIRNYYLFHKKTLQVPMLYVLHIGLAFMLLGLLLEVLSHLYPELDSSRAALHSTMVGGLGVVSIGILTRVSLGHTGRVIMANRAEILAYFSIIIGALMRVLIPILAPENYDKSLHYASGFWTLGFLIFFIKYIPILFGPRPDSKD